MADNLCLFEDKKYDRLLPLVYFRPVYDLRCGIYTLREKVKNHYPDAEISLHTRDYLKDVLKNQNPGSKVNELSGASVLFINGRAIVDVKFKEQIDPENDNTVYMSDGEVAAAVVSGDKLEALKKKLKSVFETSDFEGLNRKEIDATLVTYQWDLVGNNGPQIEADFDTAVKAAGGNKMQGKVYDGVYMVNKDNIFIGEGAKVKPGVVLDAEEGPIFIDKNAKIFPNAVIEGPAFIGEKSSIKIGAKIYENTSIGEVCKVGGEVEESIIHSYSNKQHDGFLGHAYLGMWVNLGADTNNSDLKNNYGNVKVVVNGEQIDSGSMFVGLTMGDHSKSGINTMFNTGTVVGVCSNVFGAGFPKKYIPSFAWGGTDETVTYKLEKALEVSEKVMARRKVDLTDADKALFKHIFELTSSER